MSPLLFLAGILVTYRLSVLLAEDVIFNPVRKWVGGEGEPHPVRRWLTYLITCAVCASVWIGMVLALYLNGWYLSTILYGLAFSGGAVALLRRR